MVIYGYKGTMIAQGILQEPCPFCNATNAMETHIFQMYTHVFWIPMFPVFKTGVAQCTQCQATVKPTQMTKELKASYKTLKSSTRIPVWTFAGLGLVAVLVFLGIKDNEREERNTSAFLQSPKTGDIIELKSAAHTYTLYEVGLVEKDSVFIYPNLYETDSELGLSAIREKGDSAYDSNLYGYSRAELKQMLKNGDIIRITR